MELNKRRNKAAMPLQKAITYSFRLATSKFRWDKNSEAHPIKLVTAKSWTLLFLLSFLIQLLHVIFLVITVIRMALSENKLIAESKIFVEFMAVGYTMPLCSMQLFLIWRSEAFADFLNALIVTHNNMNGNHASMQALVSSL